MEEIHYIKSNESWKKDVDDRQLLKGNRCGDCVYSNFEMQYNPSLGRDSPSVFGTCTRRKKKIFILEKACGLYEKV